MFSMFSKVHGSEILFAQREGRKSQTFKGYQRLELIATKYTFVHPRSFAF